MNRSSRIRTALIAAGLAGLAAASTGSAQQGVDPRGVSPRSANPLEGVEFFVNTKFAPQYDAYVKARRKGQTRKAALLAKIALEPQFKWFGRWNEDDPGGTDGAIRNYLERAQEEQPGSVAQVAILRHQGKECHSRYNAGGRREDARTRRFYRDFARGIGHRRVVIGFEPDSLGTMKCLHVSRRRARLDLLRYGVSQLSALPNATVYLEASASDWEPAKQTAKKLRYIGVRKVRGFMLNVTHEDWTLNNIRYGREVSRMAGGKHFIVNTQSAGRGPVHYRRNLSGGRWRRAVVSCHPLYRGLGPAPTTETHHPLVDAYLYVSRAGYSGGSCNGGPLPVGRWWEKRALMFARFATNWIRPPKGTRYGHKRGKLTIRQVAGDQYKPRG